MAYFPVKAPPNMERIFVAFLLSRLRPMPKENLFLPPKNLLSGKLAKTKKLLTLRRFLSNYRVKKVFPLSFTNDYYWKPVLVSLQ